MKRFFIVFAFTCLLAFGLSSCKSHEKCPAYGEVAKEQPKNDRA